jgi:hypothetical protein
VTKISALTADTSVGGTENLLIVDTSASATKRVLTSTVEGAFRSPSYAINWGSNTYFQSVLLDVNSITTDTLITDTIRWCIFYLPNDIAIDSMSIHVTGAVASSVVRLAIYNTTNLSNITTPVSEFSPTTSLDTSTTGIKTVSFTQATLTAGLYATAVHSVGAPTIYFARGHPQGIVVLHGTTGFNNTHRRYSSHTWAGSWPTGPFSASTGNTPSVGHHNAVFLSRPAVA